MIELAANLFGNPAVAWVTAVVGFGLFATATRNRTRLRQTWAQVAEAQAKLALDLGQIEAAREARQRAEAQAGAKGRFIATVSHEVRTPLNGILGMAELLGTTALDPEQQAYVEAVQSSGRTLAALIDEVLDFSRIEAGHTELAAEPFDLGDLVEGVVELLGPRAQDKGLEIAGRLDPEIPLKVLGDAARLRQVLVNLAGNAVKFTETGGVGLRVAADGGGLTFTVSDTGPGVPPDRRAAIFEDFERGGRTVADGTGLGLGIARRLVGLMGGALTLGDRPGGGSEFGFRVMLPQAGDAVRAPLADLTGRTALIVADSPFQAPYLAQDLGTAGAKVTIAPSEAQALAILSHGAPDLLIVDCALGEGAANRLAGTADGAGRALLLFSPTERRAFGQMLSAAFDGWLVKPVRLRSLASRVTAEAAAAAAMPAAPVPLPRPAPVRADLRVLLAEDNPINTLVMLKMLDRIGANVTHVADGVLALEAALAAMRGETAPFDAILMDLNMPGLDGRDAARRLRVAERDAGAPPTRIMALTAYAFADDRQACFEAGIDEFLTKPIGLARLRDALADGAVGGAGARDRVGSRSAAAA